MSFLTISIGFFLGALTIVAVEALGILFLIRVLNRRIKEKEAKFASQSNSGVIGDVNLFHYNKQGVIWILDSEKVPKNWVVEKVPREQKRLKEFVEVTPIRKYAKIKDQSLIITETEGSHTVIQLKGCIVAAVSATGFYSRKWAKRFPIKVESKTSVIYHGSKTFYIYLETSWEKESWCNALRLASCDDKEKVKWFAKLNMDFQAYLASLNTGYPLFLKPSTDFTAESIDKSIKPDGSSSKVRYFFKKLAKKASKSGLENKAGWTLPSAREERKLNEKSLSLRESGSASGLVKTAAPGKAANCSAEENTAGSLFSNYTRLGSRSYGSTVSDGDSDDKIVGDEGTLCWNLLISRLFFDVKSNPDMKSSFQARIQRMLSNMRSPSYIGEVICTGIDLGNLPPYIHGMRVLPSDMNEVWALEIDIEYSGGSVLEIQTRLEVRELDRQQEGMMDSDLETSSVGEVTPDLLEGFEYFGKQLKLSEGTADEIEQKDEGDQLDEIRSQISTRPSSYGSRWRSILHSVAKQVSQVPLQLGIRVASLRGTMRLHIKPPPSDQLWFAFTSMPDIDFNLESFVGEHKIGTGHIDLLLISRFKAAIRETLVLPNFENICIPLMLAEKNDWVPRKVAPFIWINSQEAASNSTSVHEVPSCQRGEAAERVIEAFRGTTSGNQEGKNNKAKKFEPVEQPITESTDTYASSLGSSVNQTTISNDKLPLQELLTPLLSDDDPVSASQCSKEENPEYDRSQSRTLVLSEEQNNQGMEGDDAGLKRMGTTRARMLGLGKKMGEKLGEKRRHIEEKGRNIVERMRDHKTT